MKIRLERLKVITRQTTEVVTFSQDVTFIHGPVGTGKSTVARLIDFCFGGRLERTPAVQKEFVSVQLSAVIANCAVRFERAAGDSSNVRVTWERRAVARWGP
jgi:replication-associated recombination protein RarA